MTPKNLLEAAVVGRHHQGLDDITLSGIFNQMRGPRRTSTVRPLDWGARSRRFGALIRLGAISSGESDPTAVETSPLVVAEEWLTAIARRVLPPAVATPLRTSSDCCACARRGVRTRPSCPRRAAGACLGLAPPTLRLHDSQNDFLGRGINANEANEGSGIKHVTFEVVAVVVVDQRGAVNPTVWIVNNMCT